MQLGFIGLGRMGKAMVLNLAEKGVEVVAFNRSPAPIEEVAKAGAVPAYSIDEVVSELKSPRTIWVMVSAGPAVDEILDKLSQKLSPGDLIIDGGNSNYKDTIRRNKTLAEKKIHFMDVGTSGGIESARRGACLMIGGQTKDFERINSILSLMAAPNGYGLLGPCGAGHFAKMIHNGIEYGMMEAIGEGAALLKSSEFGFNLADVFRVYSVQSIIESRLVGWTLSELEKDPNLSNISSTIGSAGTNLRLPAEADWTLDFAKEKHIPIPVIEASMLVRDNSSKDPEHSPEGYRNKIVSAMRGQFGQHPVRKK